MHFLDFLLPTHVRAKCFRRENMFSRLGWRNSHLLLLRDFSQGLIQKMKFCLLFCCNFPKNCLLSYITYSYFLTVTKNCITWCQVSILAQRHENVSASKYCQKARTGMSEERNFSMQCSRLDSCSCPPSFYYPFPFWEKLWYTQESEL